MPDPLQKVKLKDNTGSQVYPEIDPTDKGTPVVANPEMEGTEPNLSGVQIGSTKYKVPQSGGSEVSSITVDNRSYSPIEGTSTITIPDYPKVCTLGVYKYITSYYLEAYMAGVLYNNSKEVFDALYAANNYTIDVFFNDNTQPQANYAGIITEKHFVEDETAEQSDVPTLDFESSYLKGFYIFTGDDLIQYKRMFTINVDEQGYVHYTYVDYPVNSVAKVDYVDVSGKTIASAWGSNLPYGFSPA